MHCLCARARLASWDHTCAHMPYCRPHSLCMQLSTLPTASALEALKSELNAQTTATVSRAVSGAALRDALLPTIQEAADKAVEDKVGRARALQGCLST